MAGVTVPTWLTTDFLKLCLESDDQLRDITIAEFAAEPAVAVGNNYGSLLLRVKIQFKTQEKADLQNISVIVKSPVIEYLEQFKEIIEGFYMIEPKFYYNFIHESKQFLSHDIVPKHYLSPNPLCVVLEDLKDSGYKMVDRHKFLDWDHCRLYIAAATSLQALSVATHKKNPELIEFLGNEFHEESQKKMFDGMVVGGLYCMCEYLKDKPAYQEHLSVIKEVTKDNTVFDLYEKVKESKCDFKTLNQTDPWCTNMMFKYNDTGKPISIKLLDFQSFNFSSPVRGFLSFLWLSVSPEVRESKFHDLCRLYCDSLNQNLEELGCTERLTSEVLKNEIVLWSPLTLIYICSIVPICIADEAVDMKDLLSGFDGAEIKERPIFRLYQGKHFKRYFPRILDQAAKLGTFEYLKKRIDQTS